MPVAEKRYASIVRLTLSLLLLLIPNYKNGVPFAILVFAIASMILLWKKGEWKIQFSWKDVSWGWITLWLILAISLVYTSDLKRGLFDLEVKLSMLIFPILFLFKPIRNVVIQNFNFILVTWVIGTTLSIFLHVGLSFYEFCTTHPSVDMFFYTFLSHSFHPSYLAFYALTSIFFMLELCQQKIFPFSSRVVSFLLIFFHALFIFLLSSKANLLAFVAIGFILLLIYVRQKQWFLFATMLTMLAISYVLSQQQNTLFYQRIYELKHANPKAIQSNQVQNSTSERLMIWKCATKVIRQHPLFGVGVGDVRQALNAEYTKHHFWLGVERNFNAHSQFLQTTIAIGFVGLVLLLYILGVSSWQAIIHKDYTYLFFVMLLTINLLFEAMLETQAGVVFTVLISILFNVRSKANAISDLDTVR